MASTKVRFTRVLNGEHCAYTLTADGHNVLIEHASNAIDGGQGWVVWMDDRAPSVEYWLLSDAKAAALTELGL